MPVTQVPPAIGTAISGEEWARFILTRLGHASVVLRSGARRLTMSGPILHVPRFIGDGSAGWYQELEEIAEGAPPGDDIELIMRKCATLAKISSTRSSPTPPGRDQPARRGDDARRRPHVDRAIFNGAGPPRQPVGILGQIDQVVDGDPVDLDNVIDAAGLIGDVGGEASLLYLCRATGPRGRRSATASTGRCCSPTRPRPPRRSSPASGLPHAGAAARDRRGGAVRPDHRRGPRRPERGDLRPSTIHRGRRVARDHHEAGLRVNDKRGLAKIVAAGGAEQRSEQEEKPPARKR